MVPGTPDSCTNPHPEEETQEKGAVLWSSSPPGKPKLAWETSPERVRRRSPRRNKSLPSTKLDEKTRDCRKVRSGILSSL